MAITESTPQDGSSWAVNYEELITSLDMPTKVKLLTGATAFTLWPEESIGLGELRLSDGPTGVRGLKFTGGRKVALLPNATLLASAWSEDIAYEVGQLLADEALAQQIHVVLGPTINLHRSLLGGRVFEAYSEDPLLTGRLAAAYVRGLQDKGVGACLKHLIANESETQRNTMNSIVDEAVLRELYLLPFEIAIADAQPWSLMAAYNDINGVAATEQNHVINEIVKGEWGYEGLVMSDWFATKTCAPAANGGLDLVMPGPDGPWGEALVSAVDAGEVDRAVIDDHMRRLLRLAKRVRALGKLRDYPTDLPAPDSAMRREQLTRLAAHGMTVLTNNRDVLPLAADQRIALIGRHAIETVDMGGGSAQVNPPYQASVAEGLTRLFGDRVSVIDGVEVRTRPVPARPGFILDPETGDPGAHVALLAEDGSVLSEHHGGAPMAAVGFDDDFDEPLSTIRFRARISHSGLLEIGGLGAGEWTLQAGEDVFRFSTAANGESDIVEGGVILRPPFHTVAVNLRGGTEVELDVTPTAAIGLFGLIAREAANDQDRAIADAVRAAQAADVAVVVVGLTEEQETESIDKTTLHLPGRQDELIAAVAGVAAKTVVVVNAATPVIMPWLGEVDAVLWAGLPGQEGGHAVAAALVGDIEPAGRLVTTFPVEDAATPAWSVTPADRNLAYEEGSFIGYRGHHANRAPAPAFWLGHGLGYSTWQYSAPELLAERDQISVGVSVTNTGSRRSREVVQLYFQPEEADEPIRLVGWSSVTADPGETVPTTVTADLRLWRRWNTQADSWQQLTGAGELLLARGLGDIRGRVDLSPVAIMLT